MATQYTAGLVTGEVLTAATMNSIGAAWESFTPVCTSSVGSLGSVTALARYTRIQKLVIMQFDISITAIGTATGLMQVTLPINSIAAFYQSGGFGSWRETAVSGETGICGLVATNAFRMYRYDNGNVISASDRYVGMITYEAA